MRYFLKKGTAHCGWRWADGSGIPIALQVPPVDMSILLKMGISIQTEASE
jgi:hypothetical protein